MSFYITPAYAPSPDGLYLFEKSVEIKGEGKAVINIFAASRYILYINGEYICEGPCRSHTKVRYYDSVEADLKKGINHICVKIMHVSNYFYTVHNTTLPELAFEAEIGEETISSDSSWSIKYLGGYTYKTYYMKCTAPYEWVDADKECTSIECVENIVCKFSENGFYSRVGIAPKYVLEKRPLPMIYPGQETSLRLIRKGDGFSEYDAGEYMTAKVRFDITKNSDVKIIYSECYEFEDGKKKRDDTSGFLKGFYDTVKTGESDFTYEPFWSRAFRFIRIEGDCENVCRITARRMNYPFDITGSFECSDENFNKMQKISINSILCCAHEIISDCPYYEQQQYEMDTCIQLAVISRMTNDRRLHRKCIEDFSVSQTTNGLLTSIYPSEVVQIIPGFSVFWIMMLRDYLENTGDCQFISRFIGTAESILSYFDRCVKEKGFITTSPYWDFVDWVPEWDEGDIPLCDDEAHTVYNLYYAYALKSMEYICRAIERNPLADEYAGRHKEMSELINRICFDREKSLYTDGSVTKTYSMHTIVWSILSEVAPETMWTELISHLGDEKISKCSFAMNYFTFRTLEKCNTYHKSFELFDGWKKMIDLGCTTWCENPDSPRSECHGWSSAPLYEFSANVLGVKIGLSDEIVIKPEIGNLTYAKGSVPTRFGTVNVVWELCGNKFRMDIEVPETISSRVILPDGNTHMMSSAKEGFECTV